MYCQVGRVTLPNSLATGKVFKSKCIAFLRGIFMVALHVSTKILSRALFFVVWKELSMV